MGKWSDHETRTEMRTKRMKQLLQIMEYAVRLVMILIVETTMGKNINEYIEYELLLLIYCMLQYSSAVNLSLISSIKSITRKLDILT